MCPQVSVVACDTYLNCRPKIEEALRLIHFDWSNLKNRKVLLKVNLMAGKDPRFAVNTHPEFTRAVIRLLQDQGAQVFVAESSGILSFTQKVFEKSGLAAVIKEEGATLVNLDACESAYYEFEGQVLKKILKAKILDEMDIKISLPKLKTHTLMTLTGALKNHIGLLPGGSKCLIHLAAPSVSRLAEAIVDLHQAIPFDFAIMDGIWALEGGGTQGGRLKEANVILAGANLAALDQVAATIMGLDPLAVPSNLAASRRGLGPIDFSEITLLGTPLAQVQSSFRLPGRELKKNPFISRSVYFMRANILEPVIQPEYFKVEECRNIIEKCPVAAFEEQNGVYHINLKKCVKCFYCFENCPQFAIRLRCKWYLKPLFKKRTGERI